MNRCEENNEKLRALADGKLSGEDARAATSHVEGCAECRGRLEQLRGIADAAAHPAPDEAQWRGVWDQMAKRLPERKVARRRQAVAWRLAFTTAAAALVAVVVIALMPGGGSVTAAADVVESVEAGSGYTTMQFVDDEGSAFIVVMEETFKQVIPAAAEEGLSNGAS